MSELDAVGYWGPVAGELAPDRVEDDAPNFDGLRLPPPVRGLSPSAMVTA